LSVLDDTTPDLLTWLVRAQNGGSHIAPGDGNDPVELVDVKDVARFLIFAIGRTLYGTFNLTGRAMTFREFLDACKAILLFNGAQLIDFAGPWEVFGTAGWLVHTVADKKDMLTAVFGEKSSLVLSTGC
jgi:nucleoside-diphosphate-sugar epimerase